MRRSASGQRLWLIVASVAMQGCTLLPAQRDRSRFFVLTPTVETESPSATSGPAWREIAIGVGPVSLPDYLNRRELVTRVGTDQFELSDRDRWAEPLDANFSNVLGQDLSRRLGTERIVTFPWFGSPQIDYQVEVRVHRFEARAGDGMQIDASWVIKDGHGGAVLNAGETTSESAAGEGEAGAPAALSEDVGTLARAIADGIAAIEQAHKERDAGHTQH